MTFLDSERVLPLPYVGLRGLGSARFGVARRQSTTAPGSTRVPTADMSEETNVEGLLARITTAYPVGQYAQRVRALVSEARFAHIVRVTGLALRFAEANGFTAQQQLQVATAAVLHDAARDMTGSELMDLAPPQLELEHRHPLALHGRAGRVLASRWA